MSSPLILTLLAGSATFIGAIFGVIGQKPSNRLLGFSLGFAADHAVDFVDGNAACRAGRQ